MKFAYERIGFHPTTGSAIVLYGSGCTDCVRPAAKYNAGLEIINEKELENFCRSSASVSPNTPLSKR